MPRVSKAATWIRKHGDELTQGKIDEVRLVVSESNGPDLAGHVSAPAFDLIRDGVALVPFTKWRLCWADYHTRYVCLHELLHATQQIEGRLVRGSEDWRVLYWRERGSNTRRRWDFVKALYMNQYDAMRYRRKCDGQVRQGPRVPWERETFRDGRRLHPKLHERIFGDWCPR